MKDDRRMSIPLEVHKILIVMILVTTALIFPTPPGLSEVKIQGFQKVFLIHESYPEALQAVTDLDQETSVQVSSRIMAIYTHTRYCQSELAAQLVMREESRQRFAIRPDPGQVARGDYRLRSISGRWKNAENGERQLYLDYGLDRLLIQCSPDWGDITIGRQAISLGIARVISPNDVILPFNLLAIDEDYRPGVDGVRIKIPLATMAELDFGLIFDGDDKGIDPKFFIRNKFAGFDADWSLIALLHKRATMLGMGYASQIAGTGIWSELSHVDVKRSGGGGGYNRASIGAEHYFTNDIYLLGEWHFNGSGDKAFSLLPRTDYAYQEGGVYLLGRNYMSTALSYALTPVAQIQGQIIMNLEQESQLISSGFNYQLADDWQFKFVAYAGLGPQNSEFGYYPQMAYVEFELYF